MGNNPLDGELIVGYYPNMSKNLENPNKRDGFDDYVRGLKRVMDFEGIKNAPLAVKAGLNASTIRDLFRNNSSPKVSNAHKIAAALGRTVDELIAIGAGVLDIEANQLHTTAIPGKVGAGAPVHLIDDHAKGNGLYHVVTPPQLLGKHAVAVEVEGSSMEPVYSEGDLLFYIRHTHEGVPIEAINRKVIVQTTDGKVWVKLLKRGSTAATFNLLSINPAGDNMHDVQLNWASPVILHLPAEFVTKAK